MKISITKKKITDISKERGEPSKLLKYRLDAFTSYKNSFYPTFGPIIEFDLDDIKYTFDLGKCFDLSTEDYIYCDINTAISKYSDLFFKYFNKLINFDENRFTALNASLFNDGIFIYIKKNKNIKLFNNNVMNMFNRTLIVIEDNSIFEYGTEYLNSNGIINCSVTEIFLGKNSKLIYDTLQDLPKDVNNLVVKRASVDDNSTIVFNDVNIGSKVSMTYPKCLLKNNSKEIYNCFVKSDEGQIQDIGYNIRHKGTNSSSLVNVKTNCSKSGNITLRGNVTIEENALYSNCDVLYNACLLESMCNCDFVPNNVVLNEKSSINHKIITGSNKEIFTECSASFKERIKEYEEN